MASPDTDKTQRKAKRKEAVEDAYDLGKGFTFGYFQTIFKLTIRAAAFSASPTTVGGLP